MQWLSQLYVRGTAYMYIGLTVIVRLQHITTYLSHMTVADAICSACNCLCGKGYSSMFFTWAAVNNRQVVHLSI